MDRLPEHVKGLLITGAGVLVLTPDTLLVRLIAIDPWTMVFWRGALTALGLGLFLAGYYRAEAWRRCRAIGRSGTAVAAIFALGSILFITALHHTSVANTLIIVSAAPLFAALFSRVFLGEAVRPRTWVAILGASLGIAILVSESLGGGGLAGDVAALGCAIAVAGGLSLVRRARALNMVPAMALSGGVSALAVLPFAAPAALAPGQVGLMLLLGLIVLPVATGLLTLGPRYLPAPEVSLIMLLETVLGPFWVWLVLDERPGTRALVGGAVVVIVLAAHAALTLRRNAARVAA